MQEDTVAFQNRRGRRMVGTLLRPEASTAARPGVLVVHGFRGNRHERHITAVADALAWAGLVTLRVDLTDNLGDSEGAFRDLTVSGEVDDAQDALAYVAGLPGVDGSRLGITGHSLGGLVAALTAAQAPAQAAVTLSAVFDMRARLPGLLGEDQLRRWRDLGEVELDPRGSGLMLGYQFYEDLIGIDVPGRLAGLRAPLRIVHGEADGGVPVTDAQGFYGSAGGTDTEVVLLPEADHGYSRDSDLMKVCLYTADWFRRHLAAGG